MFQISTILTSLSIFLLPVLGVPSLSGQPLEERGYRPGTTTFYTPGLGACGLYNVAGDAVIAVSPEYIPYMCGRTITATNLDYSKWVTGTVVDSCPSCDTNKLDMDQSLFMQLGDVDLGVLSINWHFNEQ